MGPIDALLAGIEAGAVPDGVFSDEAILDATVPNWRYTTRGAAAVQEELSRWYADPGAFNELHRTPLPEGELVQFTLTWNENGVTHMCHQAHSHHAQKDGKDRRRSEDENIQPAPWRVLRRSRR